MNITNIGIVGAGQMGAGIAQVAAQAEYVVIVSDTHETQLGSGRRAIDESLLRLVKKDKLSRRQAADAVERICWTTSLDDLDICEFVVEAATEDETLKKHIFSELDAICLPETILASNTSSISITRLAAATQRSDRVIGMHFMNPVPVMPLVEIVCGEATSDATYETTRHLAEQMGKTTTLSRDTPGFIANRVLMPMINEAFFALDERVATAEDIDTTMKLGMKHPLGPLALADLIGLDTCLSILQVMHREIGNAKYRPSPLLRSYVDAGKLGRKTGQGVYTYEN